MSDPTEVTLDAAEARRQTAQRNRYLNLIVYPRARLIGNLMVVTAVGLHNAFILEAWSWPALWTLAAGIVLYSLLSWLALSAWYEKATAVDLGVVFTAADVIVWTVAIYASGAERSWLFFLMVIRAADQRFASVRRILAFGHLSVACYALMLAGLGPGLRNAMIAIAIVGFPLYTRLVRSVVLSVREREFVEAARALGSPDFVILGRHVVPHLLSPVIVAFSLDVGAKILATAGLSFLGLGTQPPTADWGSMLATGRQFVVLRPHVVLLPGFAIFAMVLALNLVGDAVRDLLDPRTTS